MTAASAAGLKLSGKVEPIGKETLPTDWDLRRLLSACGDSLATFMEALQKVTLLRSIESVTETRPAPESPNTSDWSIYDAKDVIGDPALHKDHEKISQNIKRYVDAFVKSVRDDKNFEKMDFTPNSLKAIDRLIETTWEGSSPSDGAMQNMIAVFGGYVGRVLENTFKGQWWHNGSESIFILIDNEQKTAFAFRPFSWAIKRLTEGASLAEKFRSVRKIASRYIKLKGDSADQAKMRRESERQERDDVNDGDEQRDTDRWDDERPTEKRLSAKSYLRNLFSQDSRKFTLEQLTNNGKYRDFIHSTIDHGFEKSEIFSGPSNNHRVRWHVFLEDPFCSRCKLC